jgi:hypothetical protein
MFELIKFLKVLSNFYGYFFFVVSVSFYDKQNVVEKNDLEIIKQ